MNWSDGDESTEHQRPSGPVDQIDADSFDELCDDVAGHLNAQTGRLLDLTTWLLRADTRDWQGEGLWTAQQYLAWRCGIGPTFAANLVAAAARADELPVAIEAVRCGELSFDQLMPIVRTIPAWADGQVTSLAKRLTVNQIRGLVKRTDWAWEPGPPSVDGHDDPMTEAVETDAESDDPAARGRRVDGDDASTSPGPEPDENRLSYGIGADGRWFLFANLDLDLGELVRQALEEARDAVFLRENRSASTDSMPGGSNRELRVVSDVDAFVEIAQRSLDTVTDPSRRNRYRVNLHLDLDSTVRTDRGDVVPDSIARLLTCDGRIDPVFSRSGIPIAVGRSQRTIPDRTRRTVLHRDEHRCQVPGCTASRALALHHIEHWADGGSTDPRNLITLCPRHHRMHHRRRLGIDGDADHRDSMEFTDARGRPIRASGANPHRPNGPPTAIRGEYEHPIGERLDSRWVTFVNPADRRGPPDSEIA